MTGDVKAAYKEALRARVVKGGWTRRDLNSLLVALANHDVKAELASKKIVRSLIIFPLLAIAISILLLVFEADGAIWYLPLALFLGFLVSWLLSYRYSRMDIPDDLRRFLLPFFRLISGDVMKSGKVALKLNLAKLRSREYSKGVDLLPKKGRYYEITSEKFERELLSFTAPFNDGNRLLLERFERLTVINKKQRNVNGKYKSKTKEKRTLKTIISLSVNPRLYEVKKAAKTAKGGGIQVKEGGDRTIISVTFVEKGDLNTGMEPDGCVRAISRLYSCLRAPEEGEAASNG